MNPKSFVVLGVLLMLAGVIGWAMDIRWPASLVAITTLGAIVAGVAAARIERAHERGIE